MEEILGDLMGSVNLSMSHAFGVDFWKSERASSWKVIREEATMSLEAALDEPTPLTIFQACYDLLLAPSRFLSYIGFVRPPSSQVQENNSTFLSIKAASDAIKRGQSGKALRILTGAGSAPHTLDQLERTARLFPLPRQPVEYVPTNESPTLDPAFLRKKFTSLIAALEPESPDVFGWDPTLFRDPEAQNRFIPMVSRFLFSFVGWKHAPTICSQLFACSTLISIYKVSEAERELLPSNHKHGVRPIGGQCLFGKMIDRLVLDSQEGKRFKANLLPVQRAFQSRGVPAIPIAALGALRSGFAIAKGDVENAFQTVSRQAALVNFGASEPSLANFFYRALSMDIPLFTRDANGELKVIWSSTGAPQGSVSGTVVFTAGVDIVFKTLSTEFPSFFCCAATDDLTQFFRPDEDTFEAWQSQYELLAVFLQRYERLMWECCSLKQNLSKSAIVLPVNAPMPTTEVRNLFPDGFKFHHVATVVPEGVPFPRRDDGFVVCGAPVGSDLYIDAFVRWKTNAAIAKLSAISLLSGSDLIPSPKHVAFKLLAACGIKLMSYVATVVPPRFTVTHLKRFDNAVRTVFFKLLYPDLLLLSERHERSYLRATLPVGKGGLGLLRTSPSAPALWWANLRSIQSDFTIYPYLAGVEEFVPEAIKGIAENVGGQDSSAWVGLAPLFLYEADNIAPEPPSKTLLKELLVAHGNFQDLQVKSNFAPENVSFGHSLTKSDVISFNARTNVNLVFSAKRIKNLSNDHFVKLTTVFLGLPPTFDRGNAEIVDGIDYPVESCMTVHGKKPTSYLDANADHHSGSCPSAALNVSRRHTNLTTVLIKFALEAGAIPTREPSPYTLCQGFLTVGQANKIFPKRVPADYKKKASEIVALLSQAPVDKAKVDALYSALPILDPAESASLRVDLAIKNPTNQKKYLLDGTFIHTSCAVYRDAEFKDVVKRVEAAEIATKKNASNPLLWDPSISLVAKAKSKVDKYAPLMQIIQHLQREGYIEEEHSFVPFVVSSLGELSREAFRFVEEVVAMYKDRISRCEQLAFPLAPNQAVADFRYRFKLELMRVAAIGLAGITCSAGKPFGNRSIYAMH